MFFVFLGQPLTKWRDYLDRVVDSINHHNERTFKSMNQLLVSYFTQPTHHMLQTPNKYYKYNINDKVFLEATPSQRKSLSFKYSLNRGMFFTKPLKKVSFLLYYYCRKVTKSTKRKNHSQTNGCKEQHSASYVHGTCVSTG